MWRQGKDRFLQNEDKVTSVAMACFFLTPLGSLPKIEPEHIFMLVKYVIRIVITCYSYRWWFHKCVFNMSACIWGRCPIFTHRLRSTRRGNPLRILGFWGLQKKKKSGVQTALGNDTHTHKTRHVLLVSHVVFWTCVVLIYVWRSDIYRYHSLIHQHSSSSKNPGQYQSHKIPCI